MDSEGVKYQIKGRRLTGESQSTQLSAIRELDKHHFDYLVAVYYHEDFMLKAAYKIPYSVVKNKASFQPYVSADRMVIPTKIRNEEGVEDLTEAMQSALSKMGNYDPPVTR